MKRLLLGLAILCAAALLGGCPIYSSSRDYPSCDNSGQCYDCPAGSTPSDGTCVPWQCSSSGDCPAGLVCSDYSCVAPSDASACSCPAGFVCKLANRQLQCVPAGGATADSGASASDAGALVDAATTVDGSTDAAIEARADASSAPDATDAAPATDAATTADAADGSSAPPPPPATPCNADTDCRDGGAGSKCIDGLCAAEDELCSDTTQCAVAGSSCVDGVCEPHCSGSSPCPAGYQCDFGRGVCNLNPDPCVGAGASTCLGGSTCVEGRCVAPCVAADAGPACPTGQVCIHGGCIPDEAALFTCKNDGQGGQLATTCSAADTCLHHDCYAACDPEAGAAACSDPTAVCKEVTVTAGTYLVCAGSSNLGSECDLAVGKPCPTGVCIDGFCR
jgi:hypothetical protein